MLLALPRWLRSGSLAGVAATVLAVPEPAVACSPPLPQTFRCNPFPCQGPDAVPERDLPVLPTNADFAIDLLEVPTGDPPSRLPDAVLPETAFVEREIATAKGKDAGGSRPVPAERRGVDGEGRWIWIFPVRGPFDAGTRLALRARTVNGKVVRLFQWKTGSGPDTSAPTWSGVRATRFRGVHTAGGGSCDTGFARALFRVGLAKDDLTPANGMRFAIFPLRLDGTFDRDLAKAHVESPSCTGVLTELRAELPKGEPAPPRVHFAVAPLDLAGNLGTPSKVSIDTVDPSKSAQGYLDWNLGCADGDGDVPATPFSPSPTESTSAGGEVTRSADAATSTEAKASGTGPRPRSRGGCASCTVATHTKEDGRGAVLAALAMAAVAVRRRRRSA
ncbi:MAG: hypothetical protein U0169_16410 [Polyangiaceae bacterium]